MGFSLGNTEFRYRAEFKDGQWQKGEFVTEDTITIHEASNVFHYGQTCFEGLKAYRTKDNKIQLFRPDLNFKRMNQSLRRLVMPEISEEMFYEAIFGVVKKNEKYIPPYGSGQSLYIRPFVMGTGFNLGVRPSDDYLFAVFCNPVGAYFKGGLAALPFTTTDYDRAATNGTGQVKVAGNYAASLYPRQLAKDAGYAGVIYLDPATHTKIDEVGAANFFGITKDNKLMTPASSSILPSITKRSIMHIAKEILGMEVIEGECEINKLEVFSEAGACGTAAIITPIQSITHKGKTHHFGDEVGPVIRKLYDILVGMYYGDYEAPEGWIVEVK